MKARLALPGLVLCVVLNSLSFAVDTTGPAVDIDKKIARAEELFEQGHAAESKRICESLLKSLSDRPSAQLGHTLNVMSKIYAAAGDYEHAIDSAERSASAYDRIQDSDGEAHARNNKGIAELQNGSYAAAELDLQKALTLSQQGTDLENQVQVLNNLGSAYFFRGSYSEATRSYEIAMSLVSSNASSKWSEYWLQITRFNQATLLQRLGRNDRALHIYREVEASSKTFTASDRAHLDANLGTLYRRLGDPYKALNSYAAAQKIYATQHDADGEIAVLKNIGIAYALDLEDYLRAANIFRSAMVIAEKTHNRREEMQAHLYLGETLFRSNDLSLARHEFEHSQILANELATAEEQWKSLYGLGRIDATEGNMDEAERQYRQAISLIEQSRSQLQLSALRAEFFADKRDAYDALIGILLQKNHEGEAFLFLEKSRARNFQDRMQKNQASQPAPLTLQQAQARLPPGAALLEFWTAEDQLGLIWCTREKSGLTLKRFSSDEQARIQSALRSIPENLTLQLNGQNPPLDLIFGGDNFLPAGIDHLLIVPDAWTSYVPFDLLHANQDARPLIERYDISYLPSASLLLRPVPRRRLAWPWKQELVAFGDPVVAQDAPPADRAAAGSSPQALPYSSVEIEGIAKLARGTSQLFLRQQDLKPNFLREGNHAPLLHVSSHAFADGNSPENSRLLFSSEGGAPVYLFLRELYDLDLSKVNLATISACDTERGKIIRGEGVQAFSRALLSAGADSSVTALWRVDDQATSEFMKQFYYFLLREDKPKAEALRLSKLKFMQSNSRLNDPAVWAAFVINGDGLSPVPRTISWPEIEMSAAVLALILILRFLGPRLRSGRGRNRQNHSGRVVSQ